MTTTIDDVREAYRDLTEIITDIERRHRALLDCQPGAESNPTGWVEKLPLMPDVGGPGPQPSSGRDKADHPMQPVWDLQRLVHAARAVKANARVVRDVYVQHSGTVIDKKRAALTADPDCCVSCATDTRNGRGFSTPIDSNWPALKLCRWCGEIHARFGVMPTLALVQAHHDSPRMRAGLIDTEMGKLAAASKSPKARAARQAQGETRAQYTARLACESDAMGDAS